MEPGKELLMPLLPYQKEFLAWAVKQEQSAVRGGVLAGEHEYPRVLSRQTL
jgi:DNA repair protein RAD16